MLLPPMIGIQTPISFRVSLWVRELNSACYCVVEGEDSHILQEVTEGFPHYKSPTPSLTAFFSRVNCNVRGILSYSIILARPKMHQLVKIRSVGFMTAFEAAKV